MLKFILSLLFLVVCSHPSVASDQVQDVRVVNLPETQNVDGSVGIKGLIKHSFLDRREQILVPTVQRDNTDNLIYAGTIQADGFTSIVLSLQGEVQGETFSSGKVGALLIPNEKPILRAFRNDKKILFPMEVTADVVSGVSGSVKRTVYPLFQ
ncbi:hypothetical protein JCM30471_16910 [Desulfuromonas carbonis]